MIHSAFGKLFTRLEKVNLSRESGEENNNWNAAFSSFACFVISF